MLLSSIRVQELTPAVTPRSVSIFVAKPHMSMTISVGAPGGSSCSRMIPSANTHGRTYMSRRHSLARRIVRTPSTISSSENRLPSCTIFSDSIKRCMCSRNRNT